jgi:hypothetical protein
VKIGPALKRVYSKFEELYEIEEEVKGEQGLAALALGKFEEVYEIEEAHEIAGLCKF